MRWKWGGQPPGVTARGFSRFLLVLFSFSSSFLFSVRKFSSPRTAHKRRVVVTVDESFHLYALLFPWEDAFCMRDYSIQFNSVRLQLQWSDTIPYLRRLRVSD
jgi:hypothetical protein